MKSAFNGKIEEIPGVFVDNFENPHKVNASAYFLSHCHTDHTQGLFSDELIKTLDSTKACIYMSRITAAIISMEQNDKRIMEYIRPLDLGSTLISLPGNPQYNTKEITLTVTLIPAGHSFGSVMFLFQMTNKTILFTGDFRVSPNDVSKYTYFYKNDEPIHIDTMYVDTTFIGRRYKNFPKRSESINSAIQEIEKWLSRNNNNYVALHTSAKYGYEYIYNDIYKKLGVKVYVNEDRWKFYSTVSHLVPGVTNEEDTTKIHLCRNFNEHKNHVKCMNTSSEHNFLYIHFSAMKWDNFEPDGDPVKRISDSRWDVCFATHCSRSELLNFVYFFSPKRVIGFPESFPNCNLAEKFIIRITPKKRKCLDSEMDVKKKEDRQVNSNLLKEIFGRKNGCDVLV